MQIFLFLDMLLYYLKSIVIKIIKLCVANMTKQVYTIISLRVRFEWRNGEMSEMIGKRLKELRKGKLTQEQLAQYLEVDQTMITKLENGTRSFNSSMIDKLCALFGCTEEYLCGQSEEYLPLNFAFRSNNIQTEDLESIAAINKIVMNIREMNKLMGDE